MIAAPALIERDRDGAIRRVVSLRVVPIVLRSRRDTLRAVECARRQG
jgi:hypothetical protein